MKEGYYWIRHNDCVQIAYFSHGKTEDMVTGKIIIDIYSEDVIINKLMYLLKKHL